MTKEQKTRELPIRLNRVMEITGYTRSYIYRMTHLKQMPHYKPNNGRLYFYESEIIDFISRNRQSADYEIAEQADAMLNGEV